MIETEPVRGDELMTLYNRQPNIRDLSAEERATLAYEFLKLEKNIDILIRGGKENE